MGLHFLHFGLNIKVKQNEWKCKLAHWPLNLYYPSAILESCINFIDKLRINLFVLIKARSCSFNLGCTEILLSTLFLNVKCNVSSQDKSLANPQEPRKCLTLLYAA